MRDELKARLLLAGLLVNLGPVASPVEQLVALPQGYGAPTRRKAAKHRDTKPAPKARKKTKLGRRDTRRRR